MGVVRLLPAVSACRILVICCRVCCAFNQPRCAASRILKASFVGCALGGFVCAVRVQLWTDRTTSSFFSDYRRFVLVLLRVKCTWCVAIEVFHLVTPLTTRRPGSSWVVVVSEVCFRFFRELVSPLEGEAPTRDPERGSVRSGGRTQ